MINEIYVYKLNKTVKLNEHEFANILINIKICSDQNWLAVC